MAWLSVGLAFGVGLLFGSFLNVCIARLPYGESIVKPGSHCPGCMFPIRWYDNIPLLSFVILRGRCRKCFQRISWRYPIVELSVALWFSGWVYWLLRPALYRFEQPVDIFPWVISVCLGWFLIGLFFTDLETHLLPDFLTWPGILLGFLITCVQAMFLPDGSGDIHLHRQLRMNSPGAMIQRGDVFLTGTEALVFGRIAAIVGTASILWLIRAAYKAFRGREGMGLGDVKLMALLAAFLGFWPAMLALFLGVVSCAAVAVFLLATRRANLATRLPFGSFLAVGGMLSAIFGPPLLHWYGSLLRV